MFNDSVIQDWIQEHGIVSSFTFLVYGMPKAEEVDVITHGLIIRLRNDLKTNEMMVLYDPINEDEARAWNTYQGTSVVFIIAGNQTHIEKQIKQIVIEGFEYLRYKTDYLGKTTSDSNV